MEEACQYIHGFGIAKSMYDEAFKIENPFPNVQFPETKHKLNNKNRLSTLLK